MILTENVFDSYEIGKEEIIRFWTKNLEISSDDSYLT